ncbi:MAG: diguanylate cyclase [Acidobacteriota bacterium]
MTRTSAACQGVIAVLRSAAGAVTVLEAAGEAPQGSRIRLVDPEELAPPGAAADQIQAIIHPITVATGGLHGAVKRLCREHQAIPVISCSSGAGDPEIRRVSMRLGCVTHIDGPLSAANLEETVRRERDLLEVTRLLHRTREEARREHEKLTHLVEIIKTANSVLEPSRVMEVVMEKARDSLRSELWCLFLLDQRGENLVFERTGHGWIAGTAAYSIPIGAGIEGAVFTSRRPLIINRFKNDPRHDPGFDAMTGVESRAVLAVPLVSRGRAIGVVKLVNRLPGEAFSPADQSLVTLLMEPAAIALENAVLFKKMEQLSVTDDLTGLYNVRYLNGFLYREIKRSRRYRLPFGVIFLDMDGFKTVNDRFGHLAGSQTLTEVGRLLQQIVREIDMVARYGGDEFVILLPQTDPAGSRVIAERIRKRIEESTFLHGMGLGVRLTASLGVASFPGDGRTRDELIHKADAAMYRVKDSGKNGVLAAW